MGEYDEGAPIPGLHAASSVAQPNEIRPSGAWKNPPDWKGRWCWMGTITVNPPQEYEIGMKRGKPCRIPIPASKQRERPTPDLIFVGSHHDYMRHIDPRKGDGWVDASNMPLRFREMIVDAFGEENLNRTQLEICAPVLKARAEAREAKKPRRPVDYEKLAAVAAEYDRHAKKRPVKAKVRSKR